MNKGQKISYANAAEEMQAKVFDKSGNLVKEFPIWKGEQDGRYYSDEAKARRNNATNWQCRCGKETEGHRSECDSCYSKKRTEHYEKMPVVSWGEFPVVIFDDDQYFYSEEGFLEYCEENEIDPTSLRLVTTEENHLQQIDLDWRSDVIPEENDDPFSDEFHEKLEGLNNVIKNHAAVSYSPGRSRTKFPG